MVSDVGMGVPLPKIIAGRLTALFAVKLKKADSPDTVTPFCTHVARALTCPKFAGTFGSTQVPSAFAWTFRFRTDTVQFWLSCAQLLRHNEKTNANAFESGLLTNYCFPSDSPASPQAPLPHTQ